jgi:hypothetical protein
MINQVRPEGLELTESEGAPDSSQVEIAENQEMTRAQVAAIKH